VVAQATLPANHERTGTEACGTILKTSAGVFMLIFGHGALRIALTERENL
jgi:hypothetical protein